MSEHSIRLYLQFMYLEHAYLIAGPTLHSLCSVSNKQPLQFAFMGVSTRMHLFQVRLYEIPGPLMEGEPWGEMSFETGCGTMPEGFGPRKRLSLSLNVPQAEWQEIRELSVRGVVPEELFVTLKGGEVKQENGLAYHAWNPKCMTERLRVSAYTIRYQPPGIFMPLGGVAEAVARNP